MKSTLLTKLVSLPAFAALLCDIGSSARADYSSTVLGLNPIVYFHLNETGGVVPADVITNKGTLGASANGIMIAGNPATPGWTRSAAHGPIVASSDMCTVFSLSGAYPDGGCVPYTAAVN